MTDREIVVKIRRTIVITEIIITKTTTIITKRVMNENIYNSNFQILTINN